MVVLYEAKSYLHGPSLSGWISLASQRRRASALETSNEILDGILLAMERPALDHNEARQDVNVFER